MCTEVSRVTSQKPIEVSVDQAVALAALEDCIPLFARVAFGWQAYTSSVVVRDEKVFLRHVRPVDEYNASVLFDTLVLDIEPVHIEELCVHGYLSKTALGSDGDVMYVLTPAGDDLVRSSTTRALKAIKRRLREVFEAKITGKDISLGAILEQNRNRKLYYAVGHYHDDTTRLLGCQPSESYGCTDKAEAQVRIDRILDQQKKPHHVTYDILEAVSLEELVAQGVKV